MRQSQGPKRSRNRGGNNNRRGGRQQSFDSNGPSVRIRGNAPQILEKYLTMARDAGLSGDRVAAENFSQHAEHYHRVIAAEAEQREQREQRNNAHNNNRNRNGNGQNNDANNVTAGQDEAIGEEPIVEMERTSKPADKSEGNGSGEKVDVETVEVEPKPEPEPEEQGRAAGE